MTDAPTIAVIGAGMAGLTCARHLADHGAAVTVFDKGRGIGGRLATRRREDLSFDHGGQYATARATGFAAVLNRAADHGTAAPWSATWAMISEAGMTRSSPTETRWVGTPGMSGLVRELAASLSITTGLRIVGLRRDGGGWRLTESEGAEHGPYDRVALAVPAPQAKALLGRYAEAFPALDSIRFAPCWAVMAAWPEPLHLPFDAARLEDDPVLSLAARSSSKPDRPAGADCWVLHAAPDWSRAHLEDPAEHVAPLVLDRFLSLTGVSDRVSHLAAHRWRYALVEQAAGAPFLHDEALGIGLCGDWCLGPRIEFAFLSGRHLAETLLGSGMPR